MNAIDRRSFLATSAGAALATALPAAAQDTEDAKLRDLLFAAIPAVYFYNHVTSRVKVLASDILIIATPIWWSNQSSLIQRVIERLDELLASAPAVLQSRLG